VPSVGAGALTIALKTLAGNDPSAADPVYVIFRNATAGTGDYTVLTITAATSLVISSGSSMGVAANNTAFKVWLVGFNDAGTFRFGLINNLSGADIYPLAGFGIAASTAEGGAGSADSAQTFYTGVAVAAKAYVPLAYMAWESGLAAAGTWSAGPTRTQIYGPGVPLPGQVVQIARSDVGTVATGTTQTPIDNTIPQNTEGDQYLSKAITPTSACNILNASAALQLAVSTAANVCVAMFRDSTANAIASMLSTISNTAYSLGININTSFLANSAVTTTLKVRAGQPGVNTMTINGNAGAGVFGGTMNSYLELREIMT
jgi:ribosomal protein L11